MLLEAQAVLKEREATFLADSGHARWCPMTNPSNIQPSHPGLIQGGLGGDENELLESGQEEVFARSEVEAGRIEHAVTAGTQPKER
jgi:hypothetical protein